MPGTRSPVPPILRTKQYAQPSVFVPESLLREARRQKGKAAARVPRICVLDPDGDIVRHLMAAEQATRDPCWACYHTDLYTFVHEGTALGIVGGAVGAPFAVLVAEELFTCGCELLISMSSAGQVLPRARPPYFVLVERALRDEGTSYHYLPPSDYASVDASILSALAGTFGASAVPVQVGVTWTTDAPFRETSGALDYARAAGLLAVEMEAAALYAFAEARHRRVVCFAHVTNQLGSREGDFDKGEGDGSRDALAVIAMTVRAGLLPPVPVPVPECP